MFSRLLHGGANVMHTNLTTGQVPLCALLRCHCYAGISCLQLILKTHVCMQHM